MKKDQDRSQANIMPKDKLEWIEPSFELLSDPESGIVVAAAESLTVAGAPS